MFIHHIGYAVRSISESILLFKDLGFKLDGDLYTDFKRRIYIQFITNEKYRIELVESIDIQESNVQNYIKRNGNIPYHICYETDKIYEKIKELEKKKFKLLVKPESAIALNGKRVAFLYHKHVGLIELLEKGK